MQAEDVGYDDTTVYIFMLEDCVICHSMIKEVNELSDSFEFEFVGVFPNKRSKYHTIDSFVNKYQIAFTTKTDHHKRLSTKLGAKVTPEVIIYDDTHNIVLYQGAINDRYVRIGKRKNYVNRHYLREALLHLSDPTLPKPVDNQAIGCFINFVE